MPKQWRWSSADQPEWWRSPSVRMVLSWQPLMGYSACLPWKYQSIAQWERGMLSWRRPHLHWHEVARQPERSSGEVQPVPLLSPAPVPLGYAAAMSSIACITLLVRAGDLIKLALSR